MLVVGSSNATTNGELKFLSPNLFVASAGAMQIHANSPVGSGQTVSSLADGVLSLQLNSLRVVNVVLEQQISVSVFNSSNALFVVNINADVVSCLQVSVLVRKSSEQTGDVHSNKIYTSKMLKSIQYITID